MTRTTVKSEKLEELIFGIHPIIELLKAKRRSIKVIYTTKPIPKFWDLIEKMLPPRSQIQYVSRDVLTKMVQTPDHQGVVAWTTQFPLRKQFFNVEKQPFIVLIDGIQDTRNLGAILRSAYCTGVQGVIICRKQGAPLNGSTYKAAAGLSEHLDIYEAASAVAAVQEIKNAGYELYLTALEGHDATAVAYKKPLCIVIGNEAVGISKEIKKMGLTIMLPQSAPDISYNASVAAGIILFLVATSIKNI